MRCHYSNDTVSETLNKALTPVNYLFDLCVRIRRDEEEMKSTRVGMLEFVTNVKVVN